MTEKQFWQFLKKSWKEKGRVPQVSCVIDISDHKLKSSGEYTGGHALLPQDYEKIPENIIKQMGALLFSKTTSHKAKEAIMVILAHISTKTALSILEKYNICPDEELKFFAQIALDECRMWN